MLGASILLIRAIIMLSQGVREVLVLWVFILLIVELVVDSSCILASIPWWITNNKRRNRIPLRLGATAAILHASRVLIFVMGRIGPWYDFDVRPEQRAMHHTRWSWGWLYFAAVMAILGVIGVIVIWRLIQRSKKRDIHF